MYLAMDLDYVGEESFTTIYDKLYEIGKMIYGLSAHLRTS